MNTGGSSDRNLVKRIIVAVVCAPVIVWIFLTGGVPLFVFVAGVTVLGQWELYGMFGGKVRFTQKIIGFSAGLCIVTDAFINHSDFFFGIVPAVFILAFIIEIVSGRDDKLETVKLSLFASVYPAAFIIFLFKIGPFSSNIFGTFAPYFLVFILLVIWLFDTASYFAGRAFGKHTFFPDISPKKTVEGFVGGLIAAALLGIVTGFCINQTVLWHFFALSILIGLSGQTGDLAESVIKREMGIKDSSHIIPGHGGILDRFDSLFFAAPAVYAYLVVYSHIFNEIG